MQPIPKKKKKEKRADESNTFSLCTLQRNKMFLARVGQIGPFMNFDWLSWQQGHTPFSTGTPAATEGRQGRVEGTPVPYTNHSKPLLKKKKIQRGPIL